MEINKFKRNKNKNYITICNAIMKEKNLTLKAKGLYALVMSLPSTWDFSVAGICAICTEERGAIYTAINELIAAGYCDRKMVSENGRFVGSQYEFFEKKKIKPKTEKPCAENPHTENPHDNTTTTNDINCSNKGNNIPLDNKKENTLSKDNLKADLFSIFWKKYHKGSKQMALKRWDAMKPEDQRLAIEMIDDYILYCKRSKRPLKDVSTFLNNKCYKDDYKNIIPDYYQIQEMDSERVVKFKQYMVSRFPDLIFHHNPLTFEQAAEYLEKWGTEQFEWVMDKLSEMDIHQYYSISKGLQETYDNNDEL